MKRQPSQTFNKLRTLEINYRELSNILNMRKAGQLISSTFKQLVQNKKKTTSLEMLRNMETYVLIISKNVKDFGTLCFVIIMWLRLCEL